MDLSNPPGDARDTLDGDPPLPAATWQGTPGHLFPRSSFPEITPSRRLMYIGPGDPAIVYPAGQILLGCRQIAGSPGAYLLDP